MYQTVLNGWWTYGTFGFQTGETRLRLVASRKNEHGLTYLHMNRRYSQKDERFGLCSRSCAGRLRTQISKPGPYPKNTFFLLRLLNVPSGRSNEIWQRSGRARQANLISGLQRTITFSRIVARSSHSHPAVQLVEAATLFAIFVKSHVKLVYHFWDRQALRVRDGLRSTSHVQCWKRQ